MQNKTHYFASAAAHFLHAWFIWAILLSYLAAALFPQLGLWMRKLDLGSAVTPLGEIRLGLPPFLLALLLFNAGLGISPTELKNARSKAAMIFAGLLGNVAAPLLAIFLVSVAMTQWHNPEESQQLLVGLALVAAMPIAGASTAWAQNAGGSLVLSLGLVLLTTLLSPLTTPQILHAVGWLTTGDYSEDLHELASGEVASFLGAWVILPSLLGSSCRAGLGDHRFARLLPYVKLLNFLVIILLNYSNATLVLPGVVASPDADFLALVAVVIGLLCVVGFGSGLLISTLLGASRNDTASLMFALGMNNNGSGLVLASVALADHPQVMLPIIFYNLVQHLGASVVDVGLCRRGASR
ncbi:MULTISPECIES: bile acid:sodium symporter [Methylosinus]|uniref:Na+-dependent transporter n=1 Tax=Methylosinus trichosporium (strain ATCC 35070 / NCIMB 11131 / UNIQEM 75 / OB3b) TaxID=595536 RepID=A0A2D2CZM9_METT3|nr:MULTISPECIES: bile acid:sodium symporter [Methylosinus]ATQ68218.1 Na+-dependent transporter [Methylosinus trichosporium OB3b]OBS50582.1 Na+-dependent transporter [Methylosinus sp. 3S-1]